MAPVPKIFTDFFLCHSVVEQILAKLVVLQRMRDFAVATLKLPDWARVAELPRWLDAFRNWGYVPRARQLSTGGREVCVVATVAPRAGITRRRATRHPEG